jgi:DNA-binding GntR family transcriptional regulator
MAKLLSIEEGSPLLKLRATVNDVFGSPLIYAIEYFRPDKFKFVVTRGR